MSGFHTLMMAGTPVYTVSFDYGGIPAQRVLKNKLAVKPADPYKENHNFTGWFVNGVLFDFSTPVTGNLNLTAGGSLKTYTVTFNTTGGNGVASQIVAHGSTVSYVTPSRTYYTFTGWTLNGAGFDFNTPVTGDITLVANWTKTIYTQSGTAGVVLLKSDSADNSLARIYGVTANFPTSFTQLISLTVNGAAAPNSTYDRQSSSLYVEVTYTSFANTTGFAQTTGTHRRGMNGSGDWKDTYTGTRTGAVNWTATGYYV